MLEPGRRYTIRNLLYRGIVFDLTYVVVDDRLRAELELRERRNAAAFSAVPNGRSVCTPAGARSCSS